MAHFVHRTLCIVPNHCHPVDKLARDAMSTRFDQRIHTFFVKAREPLFTLGSPRANQSYSPSRPIAFHFVGYALLESDTIMVQIDNVTAVEISLRGTINAEGNSIVRQFIGPQSLGEHLFSLVVRQYGGEVIIEHTVVLTVTRARQPAPTPFGYSASVGLPSPGRTESLTNVCLGAGLHLMFWPDPGRYTFPPISPFEDLNPQVNFWFSSAIVSPSLVCTCVAP